MRALDFIKKFFPAWNRLLVAIVILDKGIA